MRRLFGVLWLIVGLWGAIIWAFGGSFNVWAQVFVVLLLV